MTNDNEAKQRKPMIRSLVAYFDQEKQGLSIRRNLERPKLEEALAAKALMWLDVVDPEANEFEWLTEQFQLSPSVVEDLDREDRRPALLIYPTYLFLSLFEPHLRLNRIEGREIHCLVMDNCFVTVRGGEASAVDGAYDRAAQNPHVWESGAAYFLYLTSQYTIDAYYPLLDRMSNQLHAMEEQLLDGNLSDKARKQIYHMKQQLINLRQMVAPQREVLSNVIGEKRVTENSGIRDLFRHLYERLLRVYDVVDSQRDLSNNVLDMIQNQESRTLVDAVNRLTILSMVFLPLTFFTGLFDLDFASTADRIVLPISGALMFILVMGMMLASASMMFVFFKRRGWL